MTTQRAFRTMVLGVVLGTGIMHASDEDSAFAIGDHGFDAQGRFRVRVPAGPGRYYVLRRGSLVTRLVNPRAAALPTGPEVELVDDVPDPDGAFYRVESISVFAPGDTDGDGIDDLYELQQPAILNPVVSLDAGLDPDGDGLTHLQFYRRLRGYQETPPIVVGREVSLFNPGQPVNTLKAFSTEVSIYLGTTISASDLLMVVSRETSTHNFGTPPLGTVTALSAEVSVYHGAVVPPTDAREALSREVGTFNLGEASASASASREVGVFNFGGLPHSLEANSRETSVLNYSEPQ